MLTFRLTQPSFAFFKLSSLAAAVQFDLTVSTGKIECKKSRWARWPLKIYQLIAMLKFIQLSVCLYQLSASLDTNPKAVQDAVTVLMMISLNITSFHWNWVANKNISDVVVLISAFRADLKSNEECTRGDVTDCRGVTSAKKRKVFKLVHSAIIYWRGFCKEFIRRLPTFSIYEFLTVVVPLAIFSFSPIFGFCAIIGEPDVIFGLYLLSEDLKKNLLLRAGSTIFDLILIAFASMSFQLFFFLLPAILYMITHQLRKLEDNFKSAQNRKMSSRQMEKDWVEVRRLTALFNYINSGFSSCCYSGKIMAFTCSVLGTFYAVRFGVGDLWACGLVMLAIMALSFYGLCMGSAYVIPQTMDSALQNLKLVPPWNTGIYGKELKQRIKSVGPLTLKEGGFRGLGRDTTPVFIDFYVNQVIALVLAF